jgi:hypothetical protein
MNVCSSWVLTGKILTGMFVRSCHRIVMSEPQGKREFYENSLQVALKDIYPHNLRKLIPLVFKTKRFLNDG